MSELDKIEKVESHQEEIYCPNCGSIEAATVKHTVPFWTYAHTCSKCDYTILESEWDKVKEIKFNDNFPKLHNQKQARLVMVIQEISGEMLFRNFSELLSFDTRRSDGKYYDFDWEKEYMLLLFVGDKDIMFSTLRKQNEENAILYAESVGDLFKITVEPTEDEEWALAKNRKIK